MTITTPSTTAAYKPSPTLINREALEALISYISKNKRLIRDLCCTLEYVYRRQNEDDLSIYEDLHYTYRGPERRNCREDELAVAVVRDGYTPEMSVEAKVWAGLDRRDPYLDLPLFPQSHHLRDQLYTWEGYSYWGHIQKADIGRYELIETLRRMPLHDIGF